MEEKVIRPFYHDRHPLFLKEYVSKGERVDCCYVCGKPVGDLEMAYICMHHDCSSIHSRVILHKKCGELPYVIRHPKHPHHSMTLLSYSWMLGDPRCDLCGHKIDKPFYKCSSCTFVFDIPCEKIGIDALLELEKKEVQHPSHRSHPLTLMRKPAFPFYCDGCGARDVDMAYICSACEFWVHKSCASLPLILECHHHHHHHPLSLAFSFPEEHRKYKYACDVCDKYFGTTCWVYYCGDCRYFVHVRCVESTANLGSISNEDDDDDGVIEFPLYANEIYDKLIKPFVMREKGVDNIPIPEITTTSNSFLFKYHEHPLCLVWEEEEEEDDELKICNACITPISSPPYYECSTSACNYSIHFICCFLPNTIHPSSPIPYRNCQNHKYTLYAPSKSKGSDAISFWKCDMCDFPTNGMGYKCEKCGIKMDVKCASLPTTIRHPGHPHRKPLLLKPTDERIPRFRLWFFTIAYHCSDDECDFTLDLGSFLLPKSIREREWDKHPLLLTSEASRDHPSDFFCEFCEEEMHPKRWMYHCRQCDVSFHTHCLKNASGWYRNIKFGRRFELDRTHPNHPLTFTYITLKRHCDLCHRYVYAWIGLECASCYYVVGEKCGCEELDKIS